LNQISLRSLFPTRAKYALNEKIPQIHFRDSAGEINVGATRRFLVFGSSSDDESIALSGTSPSRFCGIAIIEVGVSGGVPNCAEPVDEIEGFRVVPACMEVTVVGCTKVDVGEGADKAAGGMVEILGVVEAKPDSVATDDEELDLVGLVARAEGVGNTGFEVVEGEGLEYELEWLPVVTGPG